jgi:hypothetical protein
VIARLAWAYIALSQSRLKPLRICGMLIYTLVSVGVDRSRFEQVFGEMLDTTTAG